MIPGMMAAPPESEGLHDLPLGIRLAAESAAGIWQAMAADLAAAVASARHPLHLLTVATVDAAGGPHARTVVLRGFDAACREVRFHTDIRSPKVEQIGADRRVALHWYDATRRLQIRIAAWATAHHGDAIAAAAWHASQPMSRACYTTSEPPGTSLEAFLPAPPPPAADDDRGLASFAVVCCRFDTIELLVLHASGHERIRLRLTGTEPVREILAP
jgi:pyridoxamine 5'-phosphate oxidase